jgi:hypothetical protein
MDNNNTSNTTERNKARRGFVKKTSAIAGISILPASNVWGTCNVSGVSGGSQSINSSCTVRPFHGGRWPDFWKDLAQGHPTESQKERLTHMVMGVNKNSRFNNHPRAKKKDFYYGVVKDLLDKKRIDIAAFGKHTPPLHINVGHTLRNIHSQPAKVKHLVTVYCNVLFGLAQVDHQFKGSDGLKAFLEHVWGSLHEGSEVHTLSVLTSSYGAPNKLTESDLRKLLRRQHVL